MLLLISFLYFAAHVSAHSWVECVHYIGSTAPDALYDPQLCLGLPRPLSDGRNVGNAFGQDIGMDHRPASSGNQCQGKVSSENVHGIVSYEVGQTYTLAWPPKNHVAASCTSAFIPDTSLDLFVAPFDGVSDPANFAEETPVTASFSELRHEKNKIDFQGFQNCPRFCEDKGAALCTGTFTVPDLAPGVYTFQWRWAFNSATDLYTTCWEAQIVGGSGNPTTSSLITTTSTAPQSSISNWDSGMKLTHFWDCNGMGCDATTLQPWNEDRYVAAPGYSPQDPSDFGGSVYGEKLWVVGAASDTLAQMLGPDDGCCGSDLNSMGCGKCALIRVPSATNSDWTALIMKKNRCPPNSNGCEAGNVHFDVAVPGYDNLQFSTANVCGQRDGTGFTSSQDSAVLGDWYNQGFQNTAQAASRCAELPSEFQKGCEIFSEWGWTSGDPMAEYQVVECPSAFKAYVSDQFDASGVVDQPTTGLPDTTSSGTTSTAPITTTTTTRAVVTDGPGSCFISDCGCPDEFKQSWCTLDHTASSGYCQENQQNCETCNGSWCPLDGPGGPVTSSTTPIASSTTSTTPSATESLTTTPSTTGSSGTFVDLDFQETPADFSFGQSVTLASQSLRFETATANYGNGFLKSNFAVPGDHWGRLWMKLDSSSLTANLGHWVAVAGGAGPNQVRMMDINSNEAGKVVFQLGWQDDSFQKVTSWSNKYDLSSEWTCYEWHMDPNAQTFDFYVSGTPVVWDSPQNIGSGVPAGRDLPQTLDWIGFGVESFGGAATTIGGNFDNIVVSATRIGCGTSPVSTSSTSQVTTTSTLISTTPSTTVTTTTTPPTTLAATTTPPTCGFLPETCESPVQKAFDSRNTRKLGKFEELTGVSKEDSTFEDMQLYYYCKEKNPAKCTGIEAPCTCSVMPCVCGDRPDTTDAPTTTSTTSVTTTASTTQSTTTTTSTTQSTTTTASTTSTTWMCALQQCGCDRASNLALAAADNLSWCAEGQSGYVQSDWCNESAGNCQTCGHTWCGDSSMRRLLRQI